MKSACIFKEMLRNDTQVFLKLGNLHSAFCLHVINFNFTVFYLNPSILLFTAETSKSLPLDGGQIFIPGINKTPLQVNRQEKEKAVNPTFFSASMCSDQLPLIQRIQMSSM